MRALDLFSGIGGIALAAEWAGIKPAAFCEIDPYCRRVLSRHWPGVPIYEDVRELTRERLERDGVMDNGAIDLICGGYPCQPFSVAGKRRGAEDDRHLWPEMFRLVQELRPAWVLGENVAGHIHLGLDDVLADLESEGYSCRAFVLPACAVGAPHRRDRVFIVAHTEGKQDRRIQQPGIQSDAGAEGAASMAHASRQLPYGSGDARRRRAEYPNGGQNVADASGTGWEERHTSQESNREGYNTWCPVETSNVQALADSASIGRQKSRRFGSSKEESGGRETGRSTGDGSTRYRIGSTQSGLGRDADGFPNWLDRTRWPAAFGEPQHDWEPPRVAVGVKNRVPRLKALGNAVVPQQVYPILRAIKEAHGRRRER